MYERVGTYLLGKAEGEGPVSGLRYRDGVRVPDGTLSYTAFTGKVNQWEEAPPPPAEYRVLSL